MNFDTLLASHEAAVRFFVRSLLPGYHGADDVARAVAASSAFPLLLSPIRLVNYPPADGYEAPPWIENGIVPKLIAQNRTRSIRRNEMACEILDGQTLSFHPQANHVWLTLPRPWSPEALAQAAREGGVFLLPSTTFAARPDYAPNAVRVSLGAARNENQLREGLIKIKRLLDSKRPTYSFGRYCRTWCPDRKLTATLIGRVQHQ